MTSGEWLATRIILPFVVWVPYSFFEDLLITMVIADASGLRGRSRVKTVRWVCRVLFFAVIIAVLLESGTRNEGR